MPDGTSRFSYKGRMLHHYMGISSFSEYTVLPEISVAKISKEAPLSKACVIGCRRSHIDNVTVWMLCTYSGAGTQVAQPGLNLASLEMPTGSAAILRGALWRGSEATGLLHRSPPIAGSGKTRLLLAIDPGVDHRSDGLLH